MRRSLGTLSVIAVAISGCGASSAPLERHFGTSLPGNVRVLRFTGDFYKDPGFVWELGPADPAFVKLLVANAKLAPMPPGMDRGDPTGRVLSWWPSQSLPAITEAYFRDPGPNDGSIYRVWVDRKRDRIYILFQNT